MPDPLDVPQRLAVAGFVVDFARQALLDHEGRHVDLRPQTFQVLAHLGRHASQVVTKEDLLATVWAGLVVTDDSLVQAIGDVRRAFGDAGHRVIKTIPRRGYLLVVTEEALDRSGLDSAAAETAASAAGGNLATARFPGRAVWLAGALVTTALFGVAVWSAWDHGSPPPGVMGAGGTPSVAVLAFKSLGGASDGDALARSVAADLVAELARSPDLRVMSTQSSFRFADGALPLAEVGQRLRSRYIVDGNVRREGEQLRLVVELLDSQDGRVILSVSNTVDRTTLGSTEQAVVGRIAGTLHSKMSRTEQRRALASPPKTLDVYALTARGMAKMTQYSAIGLRESRELYGQALKIDPNYAPAWAFLGIANTIDVGLHLTGEWDENRVGEVLAQIRRAIALQPDLPLAHHALSQALALGNDFEGALSAAKRSCELSPNDAGCYYSLGKAQLELGEVEPAVQNLRQAVDRDPLSPAYLPAFYATALWGGRRLEEAVNVADDCLAKAPDFWRCRQDRIAALFELGRLAEAREEAARLLTRMPTMTTSQFGAIFAATAGALRARRVAAATAAGVPADAGISANPVDRIQRAK